MENTETDIGDIGHTKHKTKTATPPPKKNKKNTTNYQHTTQHNTKKMCNPDPTKNQR